MTARNVDLICPRCGASASLPLGMTCNGHRPVLTARPGWTLCLTCRGLGEVAERHDYGTEYLACQDCMGLGSVETESIR
jgi:DnaJ-class molecular chaperone